MDESTILCIADDEGVECAVEAVMTSPVALCDGHRLQVALLAVPDVLATALRQSKTGQRPVTLAPDERAAVIAGAPSKPVGAYMAGVHGPVVYFLDNGQRVKIGHSTNLRARVRALAMQEKDVVLLLQGGLTLERALHATFAKERIDATEWFIKSDRLADFISSKKIDRTVQRQLKPTQRQQRKHLVAQAHPDSGGRRSPEQWAELAAPLYRRYIADRGSAPTAPVLVDLLRGAHPGLRVPGSERSERLIRSATESLIKGPASANETS